jgi:capsid protein
MALELPYEVLIKHFQSSYSAARAALLEAWAHFRCRRDWLATHLCQPIYEVWMEEAIALGRIVAPGFFFDPLVRYAWCQCQWVGDGPGSIDPLKEVQAARERVDLGISTLAEETMLSDGGDWELKLAQRVKEEKLRKEGGLAPSAINPGLAEPPAAPKPPPPGDEQAAAVSPSAFSGIEAGGVVAPPPVVQETS